MKVLKVAADIFVKPVVSRYLKKERNYFYEGFKIKVIPGVFHPGFFFSTKFFFKFVSKLSLENKKFLEIGCGSGLLCLLAASKKAEVTAVDISPLAIENTIKNFKLNEKKIFNINNVKIIESDLFKNLKNEVYDIIIINPPYFFKKPISIGDYAWYCGKNGEYFSIFFSQLKKHINTHTDIFMVLSDVCELERISILGQEYNFKMTRICEKKILWEMHYIYKIEKNLA